MSDLKPEKTVDDKLDDIQFSLNHIDHVLKVRWVLFAAIWLAIILCGVATFFQWQALKKIQKLTTQNAERSLKNEVKIDAAIEQQIIYQRQLVQYWDYLSKKNPKVKVPRVLAFPPSSPYPTAKSNPTPRETPPAQALSDFQLERNNQVAKEKTLRKTPTRKIARRPSPTPGPLKRLFNPRSTR